MEENSMYDKLLLLPLFQGLCKEDFTNILEKVKLHFQKYTSGHYIARQDALCNSLIFILQGQVLLFLQCLLLFCLSEYFLKYR